MLSTNRHSFGATSAPSTPVLLSSPSPFSSSASSPTSPPSSSPSATSSGLSLAALPTASPLPSSSLSSSPASPAVSCSSSSSPSSPSPHSWCPASNYRRALLLLMPPLVIALVFVYHTHALASIDHSNRCPLPRELAEDRLRNGKEIVDCALPLVYSPGTDDADLTMKEHVYCHSGPLPAPKTRCNKRIRAPGSALSLAGTLKPSDVPYCPMLAGLRVRDVELVRRFDRAVPLYVERAQLIPPPGRGFLKTELGTSSRKRPVPLFRHFQGDSRLRNSQKKQFCKSQSCRLQLRNELCEYGVRTIGLCDELVDTDEVTGEWDRRDDALGESGRAKLPLQPVLRTVIEQQRAYRDSPVFGRFLDTPESHHGGICFALMVNDVTEKRLSVLNSTVATLTHPKHIFVIHDDPSGDPENQARLKEWADSAPSVFLTEKRMRVTWGGTSQSATNLALAFDCLMRGDWDHVVLLADTSAAIQQADTVSRAVHKMKGYNLLARLHSGMTDKPLSQSQFVLDGCEDLPVEVRNIPTRFKRWARDSNFKDQPDNYFGARGSSLVILSRAFVHYLATTRAAVDLLRTSLHYMYMDEYFFGTLIMASDEFRDKLAVNRFHVIGMGVSRGHVSKRRKMARMVDVCYHRRHTEALFIRKVDDPELAEDIAKLVRHPERYDEQFCAEALDLRSEDKAALIANTFEERIRSDMAEMVQSGNGWAVINDLKHAMEPFLKTSRVAQCIAYHLFMPFASTKRVPTAEDRRNELELAALVIDACATWRDFEVETREAGSRFTYQLPEEGWVPQAKHI